jgi:S1-C subfamily serine protease
MNETSAGPAPASNRRRTALVTVAALGTVGIAAGAVLGVGVGAQSGAPPVVGSGSSAYLQPAANGFGGDGFGAGSGRYGGGATTAGTTATSAQQVGIVDIDSMLGYQNAEAAGTGMVLTSNGNVLTNNHVVDGATSITVTVVSSGDTYTATVVGTDPSADVAVLHLDDASGLATAELSTSAATVGEAVTAVGNAGGTGTLSAAGGTVTALDQSIAAPDSTGSDAEQLNGLIETDAGVQPGDSGGPLYDSGGAIVGMDTAASSSGPAQAYAIPISTAEGIATQIEQGATSVTIQQGYPAFLGVSVSDGQSGATVLGVLPDGPAASAGMTAGDVITAVGGQAVASAADLNGALAGHSPGQQVTVTWTDAIGGVHSATVTLGTGPAQ